MLHPEIFDLWMAKFFLKNPIFYFLMLSSYHSWIPLMLKMTAA